MPLISVVIPVYNNEDTITKTISSVLNQTFQDFEIIVINDGSTDSTLQKLQSITDTPLRVFSYPNAGASAARNRGISLSKGDFISFLDADDIWTSDKLELQLKALQEYPEAAVAYSWTDCVDENYNFLRAGGHITLNGNIYQKLLLRDFIESGSNPLIRQEAVKAVGGFDTSLGNANDWDIWIRLAEHYEFVAVPCVHVLYRKSNNSLSTNIVRMEKCSLKIIERELQKNHELQILKNEILFNRYKYLTFKCFEGIPSSKKGLLSIKFFFLSLKYNPSWIKQIKTMLIAIFKMMVITLLPSQIAEAVLTNIKKDDTSVDNMSKI